MNKLLFIFEFIPVIEMPENMMNLVKSVRYFELMFESYFRSIILLLLNHLLTTYDFLRKLVNLHFLEQFLFSHLKVQDFSTLHL